MDFVRAGRRRGKASTEDSWDEASKSAPILGPVKVVFEDGPIPRIVNLLDTTEALQARKKKQYEEQRSRISNGHGFRLPRCPFTGAGRKVRRRKTFEDFSPRLFTMSNFLTPQECERYVTSAEASQNFRHQTKADHLGWEGGDVFAKDDPPWPPWPGLGKSTEARKAEAERFTRTNAYNRDVVVEWSSKLKAVFEGISREGHDKMRAVSVDSYPMIHRYERGEKCEPHNTRQSPRYHHYWKTLELPTIDGYCVLVYLNGGQAGDNSSGGSPGVVGGETVFYSQNYLNGNSMKNHIAKVAPENGLAVCFATGHRSPLTEIRPVTKGVVYMLEFRVQYGLSRLNKNV